MAIPVHIPEVTDPTLCELAWSVHEEPEIRRQLRVDNIHGPGMLWLKISGKRVATHLAYRAGETKPFGLVFLDLAHLRRQGEVQVYMGFLPEVRGQGLTGPTLSMLFDVWLLGGRCPKFWCAIAENNTPSLRMVRALDIPKVDEDQARALDGEGMVTTHIHELTKEHWANVRATLDWLPPLEEALHAADPYP